MTLHKPTSKTIFILLFAFVAACFTFLFLTNPLAGDDMQYLNNIREVLNIKKASDGFVDYFIATLSVCKQRYFWDVARLGNSLGVISLAFPSWVGALVLSTSFGGMLWLMVRLAGLTIRNLWQFCILTFLVVFGINWGNFMFSIMYGFNYPFVAFVMLAAIALFLREKKTRSWLAFFAGIVAGLCHESFTIVIFSGGLAVLAVHRGMIRKDRMWLLAGVGLAGLFILTSPSTFVRTNYVVKHDFNYENLAFVWTYFVMLALCIACLCRKSTRRLIVKPVVIFAIISGGLIGIVLISNRVRSAFPTMVLSCIAIVYLLSALSSNHNSRQRILTTSAASTCFLLAALHLVMICHYSWIYYQEGFEVQRSLDLDSRNEYRHMAYVSTTSHNQAPFWTFGRPNCFGYQRFHGWYYGLRMYYYTGLYALLPKELQDYNPSDWPPIPSIKDMRNVGDGFVTPCTDIPRGVYVQIEYDHIFSERAWAQVTPFVNADGYIYNYITVPRSTISNWLRKPTKIYLENE